MGRRVLLLLGLTCIIALGYGSAVDGAAADAASSVARNCGRVIAYYPDAEGGSGLEVVKVRRLSCRHARRVVHKCIRRTRLAGWNAHYEQNVLYGVLRRDHMEMRVKGAPAVDRTAFRPPSIDPC